MLFQYCISLLYLLLPVALGELFSSHLAENKLLKDCHLPTLAKLRNIVDGVIFIFLDSGPC